MKQSNNTPAMIPASKIHPFKGHPYKVLDNDEMDSLVNSILEQGVMSPLIVRPLENKPGEYEIISGHRRFHAARIAGLTELPAVICAVSRDEAAIMLVDSNLHREHILPSEKAFAYKLKLEAMSRQGKRTDLTSSQIATKLDTAGSIGFVTGESRDTIYRYIRLTHLIPALLDMVDNERIALSVGVELSFLDPELQASLVTAIELNDCTPSYSQANRMHKAANAGTLDEDELYSIIAEEKPNQREKVSFTFEDLHRYFPNARMAVDIRNAIIRLLERNIKDKDKGKGKGKEIKDEER